jgi:hypothetical protein
MVPASVTTPVHPVHAVSARAVHPGRRFAFVEVATHAKPFSALLVACLLLASPAFAADEAAPAPLQLVCITPSGPAKDVAAILLQQFHAVPVMTLALSEDKALVIFASPTGDGWAEVALDIPKAEACVTFAGPGWSPMNAPSAAPDRPAKPRPPRRPTITPVQPEESI